MDREKAKRAKSELDRIIGRNIRTEREARNMSRDELAELVDLTTSHMGLIERGERGATGVTLMKLSRILGRPIDDFFYEAKENKPSLSEGSKEDIFEADKKKFISLAAYLTEKELHFAINMVKGVIRLNHLHPILDDGLDEDDDL